VHTNDWTTAIFIDFQPVAVAANPRIANLKKLETEVLRRGETRPIDYCARRNLKRFSEVGAAR
jgi:hypothetical protein